jgi:membrane protein YqaA with SNARE-associated domain
MERFRIPEDALRRAEAWFRRWGVWSLLLSWLPLGDVLTVMAGTLRTPFWLFALLVSIAKTGRYVVLGLITLGFLG